MRFMCLVVFVLSCTFVCSADPGKGETFAIKNGDKVVIYGDSITDGQLYPILIETWVVTRHPVWRNQFSNRGVSGDSSRSISRFERDVIAQKPDLVLFNMGFNDGGYGRFDPKRLKAYLANIRTSWEKLHLALPDTRMILVSPIPSEQKVSRDTRWITWDGYPYAMLMFGKAEKRLAKQLKLPFIDLGRSYGQTVGLGDVVAGDGFAMSRDGVHPQEEGQTFLACHILEGLGINSELAGVELDAQGKRIVRSNACQVADFVVDKDGSLSFTRICESLPFPVPAVARPFRFLVDFDDRFNHDVLTVSGLTAPAYALFIDDREIARFPASSLAEGVNIGSYATTPMYKQAMGVLQSVRTYASAKTALWCKWIRSSNKADGAGNPSSTMTAEERTEMAADVKKIQSLREAVYAGNMPKKHRFKLVPLKEDVPLFAEMINAPINQAWLKVQAKPVRVNWNTGRFIDKETGITVTNPTNQTRELTVSWDSDAVSPKQFKDRVPPGNKLSKSFTIGIDQAPVQPPGYTVRWHWDKDWAYPMTIKRLLEYLPVLTINKSRIPVKLDGNLEDWADATSFTLDRAYQVNPSITGRRILWDGPEDLSCKVYMKWTERGLCLAADVTDNYHLQEKPARMMWSHDMLHIAFYDRQKGKKQGFYEFGIGVRSNGQAELVKYRTSIKGDVKPEIGVSGKLKKDGTHCIYELMIPWSHLAPIVGKAGTEFRFSLSVNDVDNQPGKGFNYIQWCYGINFGKNPRDFGYIILGPEKK